MKGTPIVLRNHMAQGSTTLAHLVKLTRKDGFVLAFTLDHDRPLTYQGVTYEPKFGATPSTVETSAAMNVDSLEAKAALMDLGITEQDILAGLWDGCVWQSLRVNWRDLSMGHEWVKWGTFGEISIGRGVATNEVRGITQILQQTIGDVVKPACNADLFDTRCGIQPTEGLYKFSNLEVSAVASRSQFATLRPTADGVFDGGKVVFQTGANAGLAKEIREQITGNIWLQEPMPYPIEYGDLVTLYVGCLKRAEEDCAGKFNNIIRFRGFPTVPGQDQVLRGPDSRGDSGGGAAGGTPGSGTGTGTVTSTGSGTGTIIASVSTAVIGPVTGTVTGSNGSTGTVTGTVTKNADGTATLTGTVTGNVSGAVTVSITGSTAGLPSPGGSGTGTVTAYVRPYVSAWGYFVYGNVVGNASKWVSGTITTAGGRVRVIGYVRNNGDNTGFFLGNYFSLPDGVDPSGLGTGTLAGYFVTDKDNETIHPGGYLPVNTKSGYEAYHSWTPHDSRGYVPSYRTPYDINGQVRFDPILSIRLRLLNLVPGGGSMGTQHYAIDLDYGESGGQFQPGLYVQLWNMPQTFSSGPVTIGPLQSSQPVGSPPPANYSQAQFERLILDFWTRSNGPVRPSVADGQVSIFRSMPVNSQAELDALNALNGTLLSTPGALARTFRADPNFPDPYWNSALVNPDGVGGLNID